MKKGPGRRDDKPTESIRRTIKSPGRRGFGGWGCSGCLVGLLSRGCVEDPRPGWQASASAASHEFGRAHQVATHGEQQLFLLLLVQLDSIVVDCQQKDVVKGCRAHETFAIRRGGHDEYVLDPSARRHIVPPSNHGTEGTVDQPIRVNPRGSP